MTFKSGDVVAWVSSAAGRSLKKFGVVVEVVPAGKRPSRERFDRLYRSSGCGAPRNEESYVVAVHQTQRANQPIKALASRPYWPIASKLTMVIES